MPAVSAAPDGVLIAIQVQPRASRTEVVGLLGDAIKIRVAAPPVDGAANEELVRFLARRLEVGRSAVTVESGATGKRKWVRVAGVSVGECEERLRVKS